MATHVFNNSNLSQEIFAIDTWGAVICSLGHGRKHMLKPGFHKANFDHDNDQLWVETKRLVGKMTGQPTIALFFVSWSWSLL